MPNIAIIGAGIKGSALAALLSGSRGVSVTLFEAGEGPTGATLTNHGRLHAGTAGFDVDSKELMIRRQRGSQVWRFLGVGADAPPAVYLFDETSTFNVFETTCRAADIPYREARELPYGWANDPLVAVEVLEYAFSPGELSVRLREIAEAAGAQWYSQTRIDWVDAGDGSVIVGSGAESWSFDVVVNCTARWSSTLPMRWRIDPLFELDWNIWQIMATPAASMPELQQVVVRARRSGHHASVVPHGDWITLDFKFPADPEPLADAPGPRPVLRPVHDRDHYLQTCVAAFPPLADAKRVLSFDGIQGRIRGAKPGSINTLFADPEVPGYVIAQGGQASTAMLDALEVVDNLWRRGQLGEDPLAALGQLSLLPHLTSATGFMAWEQEGNPLRITSADPTGAFG